MHPVQSRLMCPRTPRSPPADRSPRRWAPSGARGYSSRPPVLQGSSGRGDRHPSAESIRTTCKHEHCNCSSLWYCIASHSLWGRCADTSSTCEERCRDFANPQHQNALGHYWWQVSDVVIIVKMWRCYAMLLLNDDLNDRSVVTFPTCGAVHSR